MKTLEPKLNRPAVAVSPRSEWLDLAGGLKALWHLLLTWQARVEQRDHLARLDARMRRDMGLTDAQVAEEIRKPFWRA